MTPLHVQLRDLRKAAGLSQEQVARHLGCTQAKVSKVETRGEMVDFDLVDAWADACGVRFVYGFVPSGSSR